MSRDCRPVRSLSQPETAKTGLKPVNFVHISQKAWTKVGLNTLQARKKNGKPLTKAVAYYRTSSAANIGGDKDSLARQRGAVEAYAERAV